MTISDLVRQVLADHPQPAPVDPQRLPRVADDFRRLFGTELPAPYLEVLERCDGLEHNGLTIHGSRTSTGRHRVSSFRSVNRDIRLDGDGSEQPWRVLAYADDAYLAFHTESRSWAMVTDFSFEVLDRETGDGDLRTLLQTLLEGALATTTADDSAPSGGFDGGAFVERLRRFTTGSDAAFGPPAGDEALAAARTAFGDHAGIALPPTLERLWRAADGFRLPDGFVFCGAAAHPDLQIPALSAFAAEPLEDYVRLAGEAWVWGYDVRTGTWTCTVAWSRKASATFADVDALLTALSRELTGI